MFNAIQSLPSSILKLGPPPLKLFVSAEIENKKKKLINKLAIENFFHSNSRFKTQLKFYFKSSNTRRLNNKRKEVKSTKKNPKNPFVENLKKKKDLINPRAF